MTENNCCFGHCPYNIGNAQKNTNKNNQNNSMGQITYNNRNIATFVNFFYIKKVRSDLVGAAMPEWRQR